MNSFRSNQYLTYLLRPGESHQAWRAYHEYLRGLKRSYARYGAEELAVSRQPAMLALGYRLDGGPGTQTLVGGMAVDVRSSEFLAQEAELLDQEVALREVAFSGREVAWYRGAWSEDRNYTPTLARCAQHLLDALALDEGYAEAGDHALDVWAQGGVYPVAGPWPGPRLKSDPPSGPRYRSYLLRAQSQVMPPEQWEEYARESEACARPSLRAS